MNLLMVNPVHPSTPHISGVRAWRFACELAGMGHRVVLLTANGDGTSLQQPHIAAELHDWRKPLVLAPVAFAAKAPSGRLGAMRKVRTILQMLRHGGYHAHWSNAAVAATEQLQTVFRPDVIWATVGKMESAFVARRLSRSLSVPWVLDLKDNWELFVPGPLRRVMARRVAGWDAVTVNAGATAADARRWHHAEPRIVYSGVDDAFFGSADTQVTAADDHRFVLNLVGSLYFSDQLQELLRGIDQWSRGLAQDERERIQIHYVGGDVAIFEQAVQASKLVVLTHALGYLPIDQMAAAARSAAVNMYVAHNATFHHKLLELLASGRPLIAFPVEGHESRALAAQFGGALIEPGGVDGIVCALDAIHREWRPPRGPALGVADMAPVLRYSWNAQARLLEEVLVNVARD